MQWVTRDWGIKLISLLLAIGLWFYAVGEESVEVKRYVPVEIQVQNEQMSVLGTSARNVQVTFLVPRTRLSDLTSKDIAAVHKIGKEVQGAGDYSFRLQPSEIALPSPQIRVIDIEPPILRVTLDELIVQKLPIHPDFVGETAFGYKIKEDEIQIDPNALLVKGAKGQLEKLDALKTEPINLVGRIRSFRRTVKLDMPPGIEPVSESLIDIFVPIQEEFGEKEFQDIPVKLFQGTDRDITIEIIPPKISFVLKGSRIQLEKLEPEKIVAYLDVSALDAGEYQRPVNILLPEEVILKDEGSIQVGVTIKNKKKIILS